MDSFGNKTGGRQVGTPKTGGRKAGTPNKATQTVRTAITTALDGYYTSGEFLNDLYALEPKDRVAAMEKLAAYAIPKLQSTSLDVISEKKITIEGKLAELCVEK